MRDGARRPYQVMQLLGGEEGMTVLAVGAGGTAVLLLPGPSRREVTALDPLRRTTVRLGAAGALLWALAALAQIPLGGLEATGAGTDLNVWDVAMGGALGRIQMGVAVFAAAPLAVRLPLAGRAESLNVHTAATVCLFETLRRRRAGA